MKIQANPRGHKRSIGEVATQMQRFMARSVTLAVVLLALAASSCGSEHKRGSPDLRLLAAGDMPSMLGRTRGTPTLIHVWATWCAPCREEFPILMRFWKEYGDRGVTTILVSADSPAQKDGVARYLAERGALFPSYIIDPLCTNWSGAIPASFFFGPGGACA